MGKSSKSTTGPSKYAQKYITPAANALEASYGANSGQIQNATNQVTSLLPSMIEKYKAGNPAVNAAQGYITDTIGSSYEANPYLEGVLSQSNNDIRNQMQAALGVRGLTGGSDYSKLIADQIAKNTLGTRYNDYTNWEQRRAQAASMAPSNAAADVIQIAPMLSTLDASMTPLQAASGYAGTIGGLMGNYTTTKQKGSLLGSLLSSAAQVGSAALMASERRVKRDITRIGTERDGLGVYKFNYVWDAPDEPVRTGVMVDEVERLRPWALGPDMGGVRTVDYGRL